jgi:hypothetical protein
LTGDWKTDALIAFNFADQSQDLDRFGNDPFWDEWFGSDRTHQLLKNSYTSTPACKLMGASGLSVKLESTMLQAFHHLAVSKSR